MKHLTKAVIAIALMTLTLTVVAVNTPAHVELTATNHVSIAEFSQSSVENVISSLITRDKAKTFYIYLDSPGGEVFAGKRLVDYLDGDNKNVVCVASNAMSMAFVTLQACPTRYVTRNVALMSHGIQMGVQGDLRTIAKQIEIGKALDDMLTELSAVRLKLTVEALRALQNPEYWIVGGEKAVKANAADKVVTVGCAADLKGKRTIKVATPFGEIPVEVNKCPI
jgi:ATP-dependent protease ClpP protease subunit